MKDWESPYACFADNPVWFIDPDGNDWDPSTTQCMTSPFGLQANAFSNFGNQQIQFGGLGTYKVNIFGTSTSKTSLTFNATALVAVSGSQNSIGILGGNLYGTAGLMFNWTNGLRGPNRRSYFSIGYQIEPRFNLGYFAKQSNISASINTFTGLGSFGNFQFSIGNDYFAPFGYNGEYGGFHKTDGGLSMNVNFGLWIKDYKYGFTISNETYTDHRKIGFGTEQMETPDWTKAYMSYNGFALVSHYKGDSRSYTVINFSFKTDYGTIIKGTFGWQDDRVRKFFQGVIHIKTNSPEIKYVYGVHYIYLQGSIIYPIRNNRTYPIMNKSKF